MANVRLVRLVPALIWMLLIFALSSQEAFPRPFSIAAELLAIAAHLVLFGALSALLWWGLSWLPRQPRWLCAVVITIAYGVTDELHQSFVPGRSSTLFDVVVDTIGAIVVVTVLTLRERRAFS